jgi:hypothetical protein
MPTKPGLHAAFTTSPTGRRVILRPVELQRSLTDDQLSPTNREWVLRVDEATGAEYYWSRRTHQTMVEPPLIEDESTPLPVLLREAEEGGIRVHLGARPDPISHRPFEEGRKGGGGEDEEEEEATAGGAATQQQQQQLLLRRRQLRQSWEEDLDSDPDTEYDDQLAAPPTNALRYDFSKHLYPTPVQMTTLHRRFCPVQPLQRAFERVNLVTNGTHVMFWSDELHKSVKAVVQNGSGDPYSKTTMARRSNGVAFYRVRIIRMSKKDRTRPSKKPPIFATVEASHLELPRVYTKRTLTNSLNKLNTYTMSYGFARWVTKLRLARHEDYRHACARKIQKKWNMGKLKLSGLAEAAMMDEMRRRREAELARRHAIMEKRRKKKAYNEYKRKVGITPDGVNFFLTKREMQMFLYRRQCVLNKAAAVLGPFRMDQDKKEKKWALDQWKKVHADETAHYHKAPDEDYVLAHIPEIRAKIKEATGIWHGAQGNAIPKHPPPMGVRPKSDGTVQILDLERWQTFQQQMDGPTDYCTWILRPKLLFGAYPEGNSRIDSTKMNARTPCINALAQAKIACYVCLLTSAEVKSKGKGFEDVIGKLAKQQEVTLVNQVKSRQARVDVLNKQMGDMLVEHAAQQKKKKDQPKVKIPDEITQERLDEVQASVDKATRSLKMGAETLAAWPSKPEFLRFPLDAPDPLHATVYPPETLLEICEAVEARLRMKRRVFVFSGDGHGRAGCVAACLLARLFGLTGHEALSRVQQTFNSRGDIVWRNKKRRRGRQLPKLSCPKHQVQRVSVLGFIDGREREMYASVSRTGPFRLPETGEELRGKGYGHIYTRHAMRGMGYPKMEPPQRVLSQGRMNQWWIHRERVNDEDFQAQADILFQQPRRNADSWVNEDGAGFKNVWTPRTRLKMFGQRSSLAKKAHSKWKKGTKAVISAVRLDKLGAAATLVKTRKMMHAQLSMERLAKKKAARETRRAAQKKAKKAQKKAAKVKAKKAKKATKEEEVEYIFD